MDNKDTPLFFALLNEIGIISQLSRAAFETQLPKGMVLPHFSVLNHLVRVGDGQTPIKLASAFQVPKTSMTHTLAGLEKRGMVEMRPNPRDARSKQVWITDAGQAFRERAIADVGRAMGPMLAEFPIEKAAQMLPELMALRKILDGARDGPT